jgi:hypothetical protein
MYCKVTVACIWGHSSHGENTSVRSYGVVWVLEKSISWGKGQGELFFSGLPVTNRRPAPLDFSRAAVSSTMICSIGAVCRPVN